MNIIDDSAEKCKSAPEMTNAKHWHPEAKPGDRFFVDTNVLTRNKQFLFALRSFVAKSTVLSEDFGNESEVTDEEDLFVDVIHSLINLGIRQGVFLEASPAAYHAAKNIWRAFTMPADIQTIKLLDDASNTDTKASTQDGWEAARLYFEEYGITFDDCDPGWVEDHIAAGKWVICPKCHFVNIAGADCLICQQISDTLIKGNEKDLIAGEIEHYYSGNCNIKDVLSKSRSERVKCLYLLTWGGWRSAVDLGIEAMLDGYRALQVKHADVLTPVDNQKGGAA